MARIDPINTVIALSKLTERQGGSLFFQSEDSLANFKNWVTAVRLPAEYKPFIISIYDTDKKEDVVTLYMMVNPHDITFGQTFNASNVYTRVGWISSLWGNNQATITANGSTAGFYYVTPNYQGGITNFNRKRSVSFMNLMSVISMFRNNGQYYMDPVESPNLYKEGLSRVINVMDTIKISYDGSDYFGSFATLSLNDVAETPYRMEYTIEFMIACFGPDFDKIDGHTKKNNNEKSNKVQIAVQGSNIDFNEITQMDNSELKKFFPPTRIESPSVKEEGHISPMTLDSIPDTWGPLINEAADKYKLDPNLLTAVMAQESGGDQYALSKAGAKGLMQFIDSTAADMGITDPYDPRQSIMGGARYLRELLDRYHGDQSLALAAYNGGPSHLDSVKQVISDMLPETQKYVPIVIGLQAYYASIKARKQEEPKEDITRVGGKYAARPAE